MIPSTGSSKDLVGTAAMDSAAVEPVVAESRPFDWQNRRVRETPVQWVGGEVLYSTGGDVFVIHIDTGKWTQLTKTPVAERDPKISPDGKTVAFRRDWDLYTLDIASKRETRLTKGGSETLRNGGLDWVYPEELDLGTAYWWSPDSKSIAYLQFDLSRRAALSSRRFAGAACDLRAAALSAGRREQSGRPRGRGERARREHPLDGCARHARRLSDRAGRMDAGFQERVRGAHQSRAEQAGIVSSLRRIGESVADLGRNRQVLGERAGGSGVRERRAAIPMAERAGRFPAHIPTFH